MKYLGGVLVGLVCILGLTCTMPFASIAHAGTVDNNALLVDVRHLLRPDDTLLAFKTFDLLASGDVNVVIVVRHHANALESSEKNYCELIVLLSKNGSLLQLDRNSRAVDCLYNDAEKNATAFSLDGNLHLAPLQISYKNEKDKGSLQCFFSYSKKRRAWYVSRLVAIFPQNNIRTGSIDVVREDAGWPGDFPWTTLSDFDPDDFETILDSHKTFLR